MVDKDVQAQLAAYLAQQHPFHLDLLRQMVAINSFTANPPGVNRLGEMTAAAFAGLGFTAESVQATDYMYGRHLILTRPGRSPNGRAAPKIGLISHLDTVYTEAEERENDFAWRVDGARIYGPGTYDIKGGTVMIYMMLAALQRVLPAVYDSVTWVILLNAAEESLVPDFGRLCLERLGQDALAALVFEGGTHEEEDPARHRFVVARKGMARYRVVTEGRGAHAGSSHAEGANAILQMADVIRQIAGFTDYARALTFNVGTVAGGTVINRVPHFASAFVEMRAFSPAVFDDGLHHILALNQISTVHSPANGYACRVQVEVLSQCAPWPRNELTDRLLALWQASGATLGLEVRAEERGGLSDGNWTWQHVPTLDGLGPSGGNAHCSERSADGSKEQEYVLPASFVPKALLNLTAVLRLFELWQTRAWPAVALPASA